MEEKPANKLVKSFPDDFVGAKEWFFLYLIALNKSPLQEELSIPDLYKFLPFSQTTVSRRIIDLETQGYIKRDIGSRKSTILLTEKTYDILEHVYSNLHDLFEHKGRFDQFNGLLQSGVGEGAHYIKHPKYLQQFYQKVGFFPYFGTLNLKIRPIYSQILESRLEFFQFVDIEGFQDSSRTFGHVKCYLVQIWAENKPQTRVNGALLQIQRTSHNPYVLEFISEQYLRDFLEIQNNDKIFFEFKRTNT
ncbi:MAG: DUF120 domain-containing protein [Promethearchaeota archaeon]